MSVKVTKIVSVISFAVILLIYSFLGIIEKDVLKPDDVPQWEPCDSISFTLDQYTPSDVYFMDEVWVENQWYFLFLNVPNNSIDIYRDSGKYVRRIEVKRDGLGGIPVIGSFLFVNQDSIFIFPKTNIYNTLLLNWQGDIIDYSVMKDQSTRMTFNLFPGSGLKEGSKVYFIHTPLGERYDRQLLREEFYSEHFFDLRSKKLIPVLLTGWPTEFKTEIPHIEALFASRTTTFDGKRMLSYPTLDTVLIYNDTSTIKKLYFGHPRITSFPQYNKDVNKSHIDIMEKFFYLKTFRSEYDSLLFRFFSFPLKDYYTNSSMFDYNDVFKRSYGVLITDHEYKNIEVKGLDAGKYYHVPWAGRLGLYIPANPYAINKYEEREIRLYIFN